MLSISDLVLSGTTVVKDFVLNLKKIQSKCTPYSILTRKSKVEMYSSRNYSRNFSVIKFQSLSRFPIFYCVTSIIINMLKYHQFKIFSTDIETVFYPLYIWGHRRSELLILLRVVSWIPTTPHNCLSSVAAFPRY